jgi:hypothetical protein
VAAAAAEQAPRLAPNEPDVHFLSGHVALARGDLEGARWHQEQALSLDPSHSGAMNELGRIRLRRHDTAGAIRHFISAARTTPGEHIYSRNIDVVILRAVSRTIYFFVLIAMVLLWVPAVTHISRFPFAIGFGLLAAGMLASFGYLMLRLPPEARVLVRRALRTRRVYTALAFAVGGVALAFTSVAFVPSAEMPQILPVAIIVTLAARVAASVRLRSRLAPRGVTLRRRPRGGAGGLAVIPAGEGAVPVERDRRGLGLGLLGVPVLGRHPPQDLELDPARVLRVQRLGYQVVALPHQGARVDERLAHAGQFSERADLPGQVVQPDLRAPGRVALPHVEQAQVMVVR